MTLSASDKAFVDMRMESAHRLTKKLGAFSDEMTDAHFKKYGASGAEPLGHYYGECHGLATAFLDLVGSLQALCDESKSHAEQFGDTPSVYVGDIEQALFTALQIKLRSEAL